MGQKKQQDDQTKHVEEQKPVEVSAAQLVRDYTDNEARANDNYKGKVLRVAGTIEEITEHWVRLKENVPFKILRVYCHFDDRNVMASLANGSTVTVKGICEGKGVIGVNLKRCKLVK